MAENIRMGTITIASGTTWAKLIDAPREIALKVSELLSFQVSGFDAMKNAGRVNRNWDGRSTLYSFKQHRFPAGFAAYVIAKLEREGNKVIWLKKPAPAPLGQSRPVVDPFGYDNPNYDYQPFTVDQLIKHERGIAQVATGGGKSRIARIAYRQIGRRTLFITTRGVLMYQMRDNFQENIKERVGVMGDGVWEPSKGFNVAMIQTLSQRIEAKDFDSEMESYLVAQNTADAKKTDTLKRKQVKQKVPMADRVKQISELHKKLADERPSDEEVCRKLQEKVTLHNKRRLETLELLKTFELVILEEAHEAGGDSYFKVCQACTNAYYRLALTATPFMRGDEESNMRLMACTGSVFARVTEKDLIEKGVLATPKFLILNSPRPDGLYRTSNWSRAVDKGIVNNEWRNNKCISVAQQAKSYGLTTMILVQRKAHGDTLKKLCADQGLRAAFIFGDSTQNERQHYLNKLGAGDLDVLIGTTILDVGVDVPSVGAVVLAGGGKAEVALRQRIGRGLRAKKVGPNICFVVDFLDEHNDHTREHALTRLKIINDTPGFKENIIRGNEIPFQELGFSKSANAA